MRKEALVVDNETVVNVAVVVEVEIGVVEEIVVELLPRVFDKSDGHVAQDWQQLGANPGATDLLMSAVWRARCVGCRRWWQPMCEWWYGLPVAWVSMVMV